MALNADPVKLNQLGTVTVHPQKVGRVQIVAEGFSGTGCSCRDVAVLACLWAIGELQREVMRLVEQPGGGAVGVD